MESSTHKETLMHMLIVHNNENWKYAQGPWKCTNKAMVYAYDEMSSGNYKLATAVIESS